MTRSVALLWKRKIFLLTVASVFIGGLWACHKPTSKTAGTSTNGQSSSTDAGQAKQIQALIDQGKEYYRNDQDEQAVATFQKVTMLDPNLAEGRLRLGMAYAALDKKDEAEQSYKKAIELFKRQVQNDPKDAAAFFYLGEAYTFLHQDEEAARAYRQSTHLKPEDEEAFYQLGRAETRLANYSEAAAAFKKALELDPDDSRASEALDSAQEGSQRIKEGKKHAADMLKKANANANENTNRNSNSNPSVKPPSKPW